MNPDAITYVGRREIRIEYGQWGWAITFRIRGWLRPRLEVDQGPLVLSGGAA